MLTQTIHPNALPSVFLELQRQAELHWRQGGKKALLKIQEEMSLGPFSYSQVVR